MGPVVVWIGGAPGAGKSTVARALARRHGLRLYGSDTRTWVHRDRALRAGNLHAIRWEELTPKERWARATDELLAMSLHDERGRMVLDDLAALPDTPLVVAEGTSLPAAAAGVDNAVWLLPTRDFQRDQLDRRSTTPGQVRLYTALREVIADEARKYSLPTLTIDDHADTLRAVEAMLDVPLRQGPHAGGERERQELLREQNQALIEQVQGFYARPWAVGDPEESTVDFVCECGNPWCDKEIRARVRDYRSPCRAER
jgi:hypothetical protein